MDIREVLKNRKSIRGFLKSAVSRDIINELLLDAHWAPSSSNQQPWHFHIVTGTALQNLCLKIHEAQEKKELSYDPSKGKTIPGEYVERTKKLFRELRPFITRPGGENRSFIESGSYRFYNAPVVIFITMHKNMPYSRLMDIGMAAENLMLSAYARGLGTCAIALTLLYAHVIRDELIIRPDFDIVLSIALGYPDKDCTVNQFRSSREEIGGCLTWYGFDD